VVMCKIIECFLYLSSFGGHHQKSVRLSELFSPG
jgi:hypothetical protein